MAARRMAHDEITPERRPGIGVDAAGGEVIDPTKNVLDLVKAESKYQDAMRETIKELLEKEIDALKERMSEMSQHTTAYQNAQVASETRRIDQLAQTRQEFQNTIRDMLAESVRTTSTLVSTQLVQIQATFDTRVSKLEAGAFTQAGKQSVADPATAEMAATLRLLTESKQEKTGQNTGQDKIIAYVLAIAGLVIAAVTYLSVHPIGAH
jgi:FtsZ-binding cell division protein ZapB